MATYNTEDSLGQALDRLASSIGELHKWVEGKRFEGTSEGRMMESLLTYLIPILRRQQDCVRLA